MWRRFGQQTRSPSIQVGGREILSDIDLSPGPALKVDRSRLLQAEAAGRVSVTYRSWQSLRDDVSNGSRCPQEPPTHPRPWSAMLLSGTGNFSKPWFRIGFLRPA